MTRLEQLVIKIRESQSDMETEELIKRYLSARDYEVSEAAYDTDWYEVHGDNFPETMGLRFDNGEDEV